MAESNSHKLGQIIGDTLERAMIVSLCPIAKKHELYLDYRHPRLARDNAREVIWQDIDGNRHKLDIVLEKNGTEERIGDPRAFIEIAWRRYTKHSKNKVQEIAGAILPIISRYKNLSPFYGAIIAGEFSGPSIAQLVSEGFKVVYFSYESIVNSFAVSGINVAWEENTPEPELLAKIELYNNLDPTEKEAIIDALLRTNHKSIESFVEEIDKAIQRTISSIIVFSIHGLGVELVTIQDAIQYIISYNEQEINLPLIKYEIRIRYSNSDEINAQFTSKQNAITFLREYI